MKKMYAFILIFVLLISIFGFSACSNSKSMGEAQNQETINDGDVEKNAEDSNIMQPPALPEE